MIYGIISEFTDKGNFTSLPGQFQYLTLLRGLQGGLTCKFDQGLSTAKNLSCLKEILSLNSNRKEKRLEHKLFI